MLSVILFVLVWIVSGVLAVITLRMIDKESFEVVDIVLGAVTGLLLAMSVIVLVSYSYIEKLDIWGKVLIDFSKDKEDK